MATTFNLAGLARVQSHPVKQEMALDLEIDTGDPPVRRALQFVATLGVAEQVIAGLAKVASDMRGRDKRQIVSAAVEPVTGCAVDRDPLRQEVVLRLVTGPGVVHRFALPPDFATALADRLRSGTQFGPVGRA